MSLLFWGMTVGVVGKVMLGAGVLLAHNKIAREKRIDGKVIHTFHTEHTITVIGIMLILAGYFLEIYFYGFTPLMSCQAETCAAAIQAALSH